MNIETKYCRECGNKLNKKIVNADKIKKKYYDSIGSCWMKLAYSHNPQTGNKNTATVFQCPNYKRKWWWENSHDMFCIYKNKIEWGIRLK